MQIFDENGIKLTYEGAYVRYDGVLTGFKFLYDANGNETEHYGRDSHDRPVHTIFYADGFSFDFAYVAVIASVNRFCGGIIGTHVSAL